MEGHWWANSNLTVSPRLAGEEDAPSQASDTPKEECHWLLLREGVSLSGTWPDNQVYDFFGTDEARSRCRMVTAFRGVVHISTVHILRKHDSGTLARLQVLSWLITGSSPNRGVATQPASET